ncbi:right-handed parallel beta-helix repeat-containing protein [Desulfuromonas thiophila]|uniref:right-handed parallel beta-helix repeat-containing protein n=1 Tax=Desulfuromonas thiophila TaxID=57664 RepID=UPI0024A9BABF|nr:right-handed parallel beta-helix repeat-containing protein [Desulfuromonas thiophila]
MRVMRLLLFFCVALLGILSDFVAASEGQTVTTSIELKKALTQIGPGTRIAVAPGIYEGGIYLNDVQGTQEAPIVITAADPTRPPIFTSRGEGAKLSGCSYVKLSSLVFQETGGNGVNIDDGGQAERPSHHLVLEGLEFRRIGPKGNIDALKLSGVQQFIVRDCHFASWGGSAIDLVGCQNGLIEGCQLRGGETGFRNANGIQIKGGSRLILVQNCLFRHAGQRTLNIGGLTGAAYFRPAVEGFEARDVTVAGNFFIGSEAPIAWVTAQDSHVHHNLFYLPGKWVGRILQETDDAGFRPCGRGLFERNLAVLDDRVKTPINVGRGTDPVSFVFRNNAWFKPGSYGRPRFEVAERQGIYDLDPMILDTGSGLLKPNSADPRIRQVGPWDYQPWTAAEDFADIAVAPVVLPER